MEYVVKYEMRMDFDTLVGDSVDPVIFLYQTELMQS